MQSFNEKKPYLIATVFSLVAVVAPWDFFSQKLAEVKADELESKVKVPLEKQAGQEKKFSQANKELKDATRNGPGRRLARIRYFWPDVLAELRRGDDSHGAKTTQQKLKADVGVWVDQFPAPRLRLPSAEGAVPPPPYIRFKYSIIRTVAVP